MPSVFVIRCYLPPPSRHFHSGFYIFISCAPSLWRICHCMSHVCCSQTHTFIRCHHSQFRNYSDGNGWSYPPKTETKQHTHTHTQRNVVSHWLDACACDHSTITTSFWRDRRTRSDQRDETQRKVLPIFNVSVHCRKFALLAQGVSEWKSYLVGGTAWDGSAWVLNAHDSPNSDSQGTRRQRQPEGCSQKSAEAWEGHGLAGRG